MRAHLGNQTNKQTVVSFCKGANAQQKIQRKRKRRKNDEKSARNIIMGSILRLLKLRTNAETFENIAAYLKVKFKRLIWNCVSNG